MNIKLLSLLFLIYLSSTYCSECTDKTTFEKDEDEYDACEDLSSDKDGYYCHYNSNTKRCEELYCKTSASKYCDRIPDSSDGKHCLPKADDSGCEYKSCSDLTSNCNRFFTGNDDEICTLNTQTKKCEIKLCSSLTSSSECGKLIPFRSEQKCAYNEDESKCIITYKDCEELDNDKCDYYSPSGDDGDKRCLLDSSTKKCKMLSCEELPKTECSKYIPNEVGKVCFADGNNCKLQTCPDLSPDVCETVEFDDSGSKCVKSGKSCTLSTCNSMSKTECGNFIPVNKLYKCYYEENAKGCITGYKDCSEFAKDECNLFNTEDNLEDTNGAKCVESDGKCVLSSKKSNSKMLEFPAFISLIIFLLF
jgi:hypothetical protein